MLKILLAVLVIIPWSLIFGTAYLAYRRVRGQRALSSSISCPQCGSTDKILRYLMPPYGMTACDHSWHGNVTKFPTVDYEETKRGWKVVDADHISQIGSA